MQDPNPALAEPLLQHVVFCSAHFGRKLLKLLSVVLGVGFVVLLASVPNRDEQIVQEPDVNMAWKSLKPGRFWQPMQAARTWAWRAMQPSTQPKGSLPNMQQCGACTPEKEHVNLFFMKPPPTGFLPEADCLPGRDSPIPDAPPKDRMHVIKGTPLYGPWPEKMQEVMVGMGCFWCSENLYMDKEGVHSTQVGYAGGVTKNPSYQDICSGQSNHNEVARIIYDPDKMSFRELLRIFWETHDPTTPFQQGNDVGTQYRSGIYYYNEEQKKEAEETKAEYEKALQDAGINKPIHTEILPAPQFWIAEDYHQQYDAKPGSRRYCGLSPTGVKLPAK